MRVLFYNAFNTVDPYFRFFRKPQISMFDNTGILPHIRAKFPCQLIRRVTPGIKSPRHSITTDMFYCIMLAYAIINVVGYTVRIVMLRKR